MSDVMILTGLLLLPVFGAFVLQAALNAEHYGDFWPKSGFWP